LRITEEYTSDKNRTTKLGILEENLTVLALAPAEIVQAVMLKSMVLDLE